MFSEACAGLFGVFLSTCHFRRACADTVKVVWVVVVTPVICGHWKVFISSSFLHVAVAPGAQGRWEASRFAFVRLRGLPVFTASLQVICVLYFFCRLMIVPLRMASGFGPRSCIMSGGITVVVCMKKSPGKAS